MAYPRFPSNPYYGINPEAAWQQAMDEASARTEREQAEAEKARLEAEQMQAKIDAQERATRRMANPFIVAQPDYTPIPDTPEMLANRAAFVAANPTPVENITDVVEAPWVGQGSPNLIVKGNYKDYVADQVARGLMSPPRNLFVNPNAPETVMREEMGPFGWKPPTLPSTGFKPGSLEGKIIADKEQVTSMFGKDSPQARQFDELLDNRLKDKDLPTEVQGALNAMERRWTELTFGDDNTDANPIEAAKIAESIRATRSAWKGKKAVSPGTNVLKRGRFTVTY